MNGYKGKMGVVVGVADPRMPMHGFLCNGAGCSNDYKMAWWGSIHPLNIYNLEYQPTLVYSYLKKRTLIKWASTNTASFKESHEHKLTGPDCKMLWARTRLGLPYASGDAFHSPVHGDVVTTETTIPPDELIGLFQGGLVGIC